MEFSVIVRPRSCVTDLTFNVVSDADHETRENKEEPDVRFRIKSEGHLAGTAAAATWCYVSRHQVELVFWRTR